MSHGLIKALMGWHLCIGCGESSGQEPANATMLGLSGAWTASIVSGDGEQKEYWILS